jgi:hypothetical protein
VPRSRKSSIAWVTLIPAITLQVYAHFFKHTESGAADRLANVVLNGVGSAEELEKSGHFVGTQGSQAVEVIAGMPISLLELSSDDIVS